jgi:hypothetical protein
MSKVIISKYKRNKIKSMLWALTSACFMVAIQEGKVTDGMIRMRDKFVQEIMDLLDKN